MTKPSEYMREVALMGYDGVFDLHKKGRMHLREARALADAYLVDADEHISLNFEGWCVFYLLVAEDLASLFDVN